VSLSWIGQSPPLREEIARCVGNAHAPYAVDGAAAVKARLNESKSRLDLLCSDPAFRCDLNLTTARDEQY
jgi:hypothetical protein